MLNWMPLLSSRLDEMMKLTVSLSQEARQRIDAKARELSLTRSAYVEQLVEADAKAELERLLDEAYRATAGENREFAEAALPLAWEVLKVADPAW